MSRSSRSLTLGRPMGQGRMLETTPITSLDDEITSGNLPTNDFTAGESGQPEFVPIRSGVEYRSPSPARTTVTSRTSRRSRATSWFGESELLVAAVTEARGVQPAVGLAIINVYTGEVVISQIGDNQFYSRTIHKLQIFAPSEVLMPTSVCPPNTKSSLFSFIADYVQTAAVVPVSRSFWSETTGLELIKALAIPDDAETVQVALRGNFYATCALAAAIRYVQDNHDIHILGHSLRMRYEPSEDTMMIDISAIQSLELLQNLRSSQSKDSLFGFLNRTQTSMGARMLKRSILQPSTLRESILNPRYDALEELVTNEELFIEIKKAVRDFPDIEKLLTKLVVLRPSDTIYEAEQDLNTVLKIKTFLEQARLMYRTLQPVRSQLLVRVRNICTPDVIEPVRQLISQVIHDDITFVKAPVDQRNQRTFAVKPGILALLDVARQTYKERTAEVHEHLRELNARLRIKAVLKYDEKRKYFLQLPRGDIEELPPQFINVVRVRGAIQFTTVELKKMNNLIVDASHEAAMRSKDVIRDLLGEIRLHIQDLLRVCESIAQIDMIVSFAQVSIAHGYVRPGLASTLALKSARHPILDQNLGGKLIPNDFYASELCHFHVITGCNMSGKSTYIRTIALLQIMAQIGCYVPAESATFPIICKLFARVSMDDNIETNMSSFSTEMREMAFILRNVDQDSLAIVDELGRGTSTRDGLAIAIAIAEALIKSGGRVWFVTHFEEIGQVLADRPGVWKLQLETESRMTTDNIPKKIMLYKAKSGANREEHYGIELARAMGFPDRFMAVAEEVSARLREQREARKRDSDASKLARRRHLILNLRELLQQASETDMDEPSLAAYLVRLRDEFVHRMSAIEEHGTDEGVNCKYHRHGGSEDEESYGHDGNKNEDDDDDDDLDETMMGLAAERNTEG